MNIGNDKLIGEDAVLSLFSDKIKNAPSKYLQFLADGLEQKDQLKLSSGGRHLSQALNSALDDDDLYDQRILGGGSFVEKILATTQFESETTLSLNTIIDRVATHFDLDSKELSRPCRQTEIARAKAVICYLAVRRNSIAGIDVAEKLSYSTSAVSRAAKRGEQLFKEEGTLERLFR